MAGAVARQRRWPQIICSNSGTSTVSWGMADSTLPRLTAGELACLRGVAEHKGSKEIALDTGFSRGTVDVYLASAFKKLGASDRRTAVRVLARSYPGLLGKTELDFSSVELRSGNRLGVLVSRLPWPFPTRGRPTNDRTLTEKFVSVALAATCLMFVAAAYLAMIALISDKL